VKESEGCSSVIYQNGLKTGPEQQQESTVTICRRCNSTTLGLSLANQVMNTAGEEGAEPLTDVDTCLLLVCGLPGCGKSTFCRELLARATREPELLGFTSVWHHMSYDAMEAELRGTASFTPECWQAARQRVAEAVSDLLATCSGGRMVILLDDNMYYRSMRKQWYHFARDRNCAFHQLFLQAPQEICLARNAQRDGSQQVPEFSIHHMAETFEWPQIGGSSWEAKASVSTLLDSSNTDTCSQVDTFVASWLHPESIGFWAPLVPEEIEQDHAEVQSDAHECDVALRRVVSRALASIPRDLGAAKQNLAKQWGSRKAGIAKQLAAKVKADNIPPAGVADLINNFEVAFLGSCVADVQRLVDRETQ